MVGCYMCFLLFLVSTESNKRKTAAEVMEQAKAFEPWFGIEQVSQSDPLCCVA